MSDILKRRDFIKSTSVLGASFAISNTTSAFFNGADDIEIKNNYFTITFDKKNGAINIHRANNIPLITGGTICVNLDTGKHFISANYKHRSITTDFNDLLGAGKKLIIHSKDADKKLDVETRNNLSGADIYYFMIMILTA